MNITTLYRFYDSDDRLLYVGISEKGPERWKAHRKDKPWWTDVTRTTTEHYDTRQAALDAERAAIKAEKPVHNVVHNRSNRKRDERATAKGNANDEWWWNHDWPESMIHKCAYCNNLINDGDGYVWTDPKWKEPFWLPTHRKCDPWIDTTGYWIAVERIRTKDQYDEWIAHLSTKWWFIEAYLSDVLWYGHEWWHMNGFISDKLSVFR